MKQRASRRQKILLVGVLLLLLIALGAAVGWWRFLRPERLRPRVEQALTAALNADVSVGSAHWSWFSGLLLRDVVVREGPDGVPPVLKAAILRVTPSYCDLLRGRFTLKRVRMGTAELNVALTPAFAWPFYEKLPKSAAAAGIPEVIITRSTVRVSMPDAPDVFPAIELSEVAASVRSAGDGSSLATFSADGGALGQFSGSARVAPGARSLTGELRIEKLALTPALRKHLPAAARNVWDALEPGKGVLQLTASLDWDSARDEPLRYAVTLQLHDGEFHPQMIGFPLEGMALDAKVSDGKIEHLAVTGRSGSIDLTGSGEGIFRSGRSFVGSFTAEAKGIRFNNELYAALPKLGQEIWDAIRPEGAVDIALTATLPKSGKPALRAHLAMHNVQVAPAGFPLELSGINGSLDWDLQKFSTSGIEGRISGAPFTLAPGYAVLAPDGPISLALRVDNLLLDRPLKELFPILVNRASPAAQPFLDPLRVSGALDLALSAAREKGGPLRLKGAVKARDMLLAHPQRGALQNVNGDLAYETVLAEEDGALVQREWSLAVGRGTAVWRGGSLFLEPFKLSGPAEAMWKIAVSAKDLPVDEQIASLLPKTALPAWNQFKPTGVADITLTVEARAGGHGGTRTDMFASLRNGNVKYAGFPYPLQDVSGTVAVVDDQLDQAHCKGKNGLASVAVDVTRKAESDGGETLFVHVGGADIPLDRDLYDAMPRPYQEFWDSFSISAGAFEALDLNIVVLPRREGREPFNFTLATTLSRVKMQKSVPIFLDRGRLVVQHAESTPSGGVEAEGTFYLERATVERSTLEDLSGFFRWKEHGLSIEDLVGRACEGTLSGVMYVATGDPDVPGRQFRGKLTLYDADVARVLQEEAGVPEGEMTGRLDASMDFKAPLDDSGKFRAVGGMTIRKGTIGKLPGFLSVLNLLAFSKLGAPAFSGLEMAYEMRGSLLLIRKLNLTGDVLSLEGTGKVQPDGDVQLIFVPYFGPQLPQIPVISSILDDIASTIKSIAIPISVYGNYNDPVWRINPLMPVTRIIQGVVGGVVPAGKKAETVSP